MHPNLSFVEVKVSEEGVRGVGGCVDGRTEGPRVDAVGRAVGLRAVTLRVGGGVEGSYVGKALGIFVGGRVGDTVGGNDGWIFT